MLEDMDFVCDFFQIFISSGSGQERRFYLVSRGAQIKLCPFGVISSHAKGYVCYSISEPQWLRNDVLFFKFENIVIFMKFYLPPGALRGHR